MPEKNNLIVFTAGNRVIQRNIESRHRLDVNEKPAAMATVLFVDLSGFTPLSENKAQELEVYEVIGLQDN